VSLGSCQIGGECAQPCARRSVCFSTRSDWDFVLEWHIGSQYRSRRPPGYCRNTSWSVRWTPGLWYKVAAITWLR